MPAEPFILRNCLSLGSFVLKDMEVIGSFDLHQHHLFLIDKVELFTKVILHQTGYVSTIKLSLFSGAMSFKSMKYIHQPTMHSSR